MTAHFPSLPPTPFTAKPRFASTARPAQVYRRIAGRRFPVHGVESLLIGINPGKLVRPEFVRPE